MQARTVSRWLMPILGAALLLGSYGIAEATGTWVTSGKVTVVAGRLTPADLKGWMTIRQAADGLGVPADALLALLDAPAASRVTVDTALKDLEAAIPGFSLTDFRTKVAAWLASRSGQPSTSARPPAGPQSLPTETRQPSTGTGSEPAPPPPDLPRSSGAITPATSRTGSPTTTQSIIGAQTLRQVAQASGLNLDRLVAECGLPASTNPDLTLKQLKDTVPGFEIQTVRDAVARLTTPR